MKVAIVTGGTGGVGRAVCRQLVGEGHRVVAFYRSNEAAAAQLRTQLGIPFLRCDVSNQEACESAIKSVESSVGPVDILVNAAAISRAVPFHTMSKGDWYDVVRTDLDSMFNMCRPIIPGMRDRRFGRIVNMASIDGQRGCRDQTSYSAAKAGVIGFTRALALENARYGVAVNVVSPGNIQGDPANGWGSDSASPSDIPAGRPGSPEEVARCVCFLADEASGYITGQTININGGSYMS